MLRTLVSSRKLLAWVVVSFCALLAAVAVAAYATGQRADAQRAANRASCVQIQRLNRVITGTLERSRRNVPRISYYRRHRRELRSQLREINRELAAFRPRDCR